MLYSVPNGKYIPHWIFPTFKSYWEVIQSGAFKKWNMEGVEFALSLAWDKKLIYSEEQEGTVTSRWLCDGEKLAAVSSPRQDSVAQSWLAGDSSFPNEGGAAWI